MSCCITLDELSDWYDWQGAQPQEITDLIALAKLGDGFNPITAGTKTRVTDFASQSWDTSQLTILSQPTCTANGSDKAGNIANAEQWMFDHKTWNDSATLPDALKKVMFMRLGPRWRMNLNLNVTGPANLAEIYLALRDNGGTRGDYAGTYPVLKWTALPIGYSGTITLMVDLKRLGRYNVVLWAKSIPWAPPPPPGGTPVYQTTYSMTEMEWIVIS